jgi:hypothetical protein
MLDWVKINQQPQSLNRKDIYIMRNFMNSLINFSKQANPDMFAHIFGDEKGNYMWNIYEKSGCNIVKFYNHLQDKNSHEEETFLKFLSIFNHSNNILSNNVS